MGIEYHVAGPSLIRVDAGPPLESPVTLKDLGYTLNGAVCRDETMWYDVFADCNGGEKGHPVDAFYLSQQTIIRLELVRWDWTVANYLLARLPPNRVDTAVLGAQFSVGVPAPPGYGMLANDARFNMQISPTVSGEARTYRLCVLRGAAEVNKGAKHSRLLLEVLAFRDSDPAGGTPGVYTLGKPYGYLYADSLV